MTHDELRELLAAAALDSLEGEEARELAAHLDSCPTCPDELAELRLAAGWIGFDADPVAPPPALRDRVLAARMASAPAPPAEPVRKPARASRSATALVGFALAAGIASLVVYTAGLKTRVHTIESQLEAERSLTRFLTAPDTATIMLAGTETTPKSRVKLAYDRHTGRAILFGYDLPPPPEGKAYQMWFIAGGKPLPGRVFEPDATGRGWWSDEVPPEGRDASVFAVTLEPASGVATPTGPMVLKSVSLS